MRCQPEIIISQPETIRHWPEIIISQPETIRNWPEIIRSQLENFEVNQKSLEVNQIS